MSEITGILMLDVHPNPITGVTAAPKHVVRVAQGVGSHHGQVCVIIADLTAAIVDSTLIINRGTWNATTLTFTPAVSEPRICAISAPAGLTVSESILYSPNSKNTDEAFQFITTGDGETKVHVRIQGKTVQVAP